MNNVLNSGDVPNLYKNEDLDAITQACRSACQSAGITPTKANVFNCYIQRVKGQVHVAMEHKLGVKSQGVILVNNYKFKCEIVQISVN